MRVEVGGVVLDLTDDQVEDLRAQLGVEPIDGGPAMIDTAEAARRLGFSVDYVREHAIELGGRKLSEGPKAPWRFDPANLGAPEERPSPPPPSHRRRRRAAARTGERRLLEVRG